MEYAQHPQSQVVQTSWAVLALIYGEYPDVEVIKKACGLLMSRQKEDGRWEQEDTEGIFNKNCAIDYPGMSLFFLLFNSISPWNLLRSIGTSLCHLLLPSIDPVPIGSYCALEVLSKFLGRLALVSQLTSSIQIHLLYLGTREGRQVPQPAVDSRV
jgi:hypothetical protein